jgi:uncharacterized integral membrane protein (TIGR00697 family)
MKNDFKFLSLFGMLIVTNKLFSMILAPRILTIFGIILPGGIIPFCIIFMLLDIITNHYKYENAKKIILFNALCEAAMAALIYFTFKLHPNQSFNQEAEFIAVLQPTINIFFASLLATIISYFFNCYIFSKLYFSFEGKYLGLRCVISTAIGELVFSMIWTPIYFWGRLDIHSIQHLIINQYLFKVGFELVTLPITYLLIYLLAKYENPVNIKYKNFTPEII